MRSMVEGAATSSRLVRRDQNPVPLPPLPPQQRLSQLLQRRPYPVVRHPFHLPGHLAPAGLVEGRRWGN